MSSLNHDIDLCIQYERKVVDNTILQSGFLQQWGWTLYNQTLHLISWKLEVKPDEHVNEITASSKCLHCHCYFDIRLLTSVFWDINRIKWLLLIQTQVWINESTVSHSMKEKASLRAQCFTAWKKEHHWKHSLTAWKKKHCLHSHCHPHISFISYLHKATSNWYNQRWKRC